MSHDASGNKRDKAIAKLHIKVSRPEIREVATSEQGEQKIESERGTLLIQAAHAARQGVRDSMEDAHVFKENFEETRSQCTSGSHCLFGVFDGHGGATAADCCSRRFPDILKKYLRLSTHVHTALRKAIEECDEEVVEYATDGSGSTGSICLIDCVTHDLYVANVGDSRCILVSNVDIRDDDTEPSQQEPVDETLFAENPHQTSDIGVRQLSIEHKPKDKKEKDRITQCGGFVVGGRVMGVLGVSRAFGDRDFKQMNGELIVSWPDITHHKLTPAEEYVIIACDGLFDVMTNDEVGGFIREHNLIPGFSIERLARSIVDEAIRNRRAHDNVSTIVVKLSLERPREVQAQLGLSADVSRSSLTSLQDLDEASHRRVGNAETAEIVEFAAATLPTVESVAEIRVDQLDPNMLDQLASEYPRDSIASAASGMSAQSNSIPRGHALLDSQDLREISISESGDAIIEDVSDPIGRADMEVDVSSPNVHTALV